MSDFYIYTLEKYALTKGLTGLQVLALMKRYRVDDFLIRSLRSASYSGNRVYD